MKHEEPILQYVGHDNWRLAQDCLYLVGATIFIPMGYETDLASIPRFLWNCEAPFELSTLAPVIHDFIYRHAGALPNGAVYTRAQADALFHRLMLEQDVNSTRARLAYYAVRLFGRKAWKAQ